MTLPRNGCGDETTSLDYEPPCHVCQQYEGHGCDCEPCDSCAELTAGDALTAGLDGRTRCASCHLEADMKIICRERPAFRPNVAHLYAAAWAVMMRGGR